jgi:hypothetical protein
MFSHKHLLIQFQFSLQLLNNKLLNPSVWNLPAEQKKLHLGSYEPQLLDL